MKEEDPEALESLAKRYRVLQQELEARKTYVPESKSEKLAQGIRKIGDALSSAISKTTTAAYKALEELEEEKLEEKEEVEEW